MPTPSESIADIREALVKAEKWLKIAHRRAHQALVEHGHMLNLDDDEAATLAGGGTPKLPPPEDEGD